MRMTFEWGSTASRVHRLEPDLGRDRRTVEREIVKSSKSNWLYVKFTGNQSEVDIRRFIDELPRGLISNEE